MKLSDHTNIDTGELISSIVPKKIPEKDTSNNVEDSSYIADAHSSEKLKYQNSLNKNIYTIDGIPSRWEHNIKHSSWHFDPLIPAEEDTPLHFVACTFEGNWADAVEIGFKENAEKTLANYRPRSQSKQDKDLHDGELMDVLRGSGKNDISSVMQLRLYGLKRDGTWKKDDRKEFIPFFNMVEALGIDLHQLRLNIQMTGQITPMHIDQNMRYCRDQWKQIWKDGGGDKDPLRLRRFLVMLGDWDYGHAWLFGNQWYSGYKKGEAVTWDWTNDPHGTANFGFKPRATLQITGFISERTEWLMANGSKDLIIQV